MDLISCELLVEIKIKKADARDIEPRSTKMHNLELGDNLNYCTAEVIVFKFLFLGTDERNDLVFYRHSIYYHLNSSLDIIVVSQTQTNCF